MLRSQAPVQASLQVLQELGEQLKQQVDTSAASAIQSDHLSLTQRLTAVEQALTRQLTTLQVKEQHPVSKSEGQFYTCGLTCLSVLFQTGVQDYETFNAQLESLGCWIVEAEEALKLQDPNGTTDLTVIQDRMDELKVFCCLFFFLSEGLLVTINPDTYKCNFCLFTETHVKIQQHGS